MYICQDICFSYICMIACMTIYCTMLRAMIGVQANYSGKLFQHKNYNHQNNQFNGLAMREYSCVL